MTSGTHSCWYFPLSVSLSFSLSHTNTHTETVCHSQCSSSVCVTVNIDTANSDPLCPLNSTPPCVKTSPPLPHRADNHLPPNAKLANRCFKWDTPSFFKKKKKKGAKAELKNVKSAPAWPPGCKIKSEGCVY